MGVSAEGAMRCPGRKEDSRRLEDGCGTAATESVCCKAVSLSAVSRGPSDVATAASQEMAGTRDGRKVPKDGGLGGPGVGIMQSGRAAAPAVALVDADARRSAPYQEVGRKGNTSGRRGSSRAYCAPVCRTEDRLGLRAGDDRSRRTRVPGQSVGVGVVTGTSASMDKRGGTAVGTVRRGKEVAPSSGRRPTLAGDPDCYILGAWRTAGGRPLGQTPRTRGKVVGGCHQVHVTLRLPELGKDTLKTVRLRVGKDPSAPACRSQADRGVTGTGAFGGTAGRMTLGRGRKAQRDTLSLSCRSAKV